MQDILQETGDPLEEIELKQKLNYLDQALTMFKSIFGLKHSIVAKIYKDIAKT